MSNIVLIKHVKSCPGFRLFGLGPKLKPCNGLKQLQNLFEKHTFWAVNRSKKDLKVMLENSSVVITLWAKNKLIGFGRATSDTVYRAVIWDIVIDKNLQKIGLGKMVLEALLKSKHIKNVEKIYLMTTNESDFYKQIGFSKSSKQNLMYIQK